MRTNHIRDKFDSLSPCGRKTVVCVEEGSIWRFCTLRKFASLYPKFELSSPADVSSYWIKGFHKSRIWKKSKTSFLNFTTNNNMKPSTSAQPIFQIAQKKFVLVDCLELAMKISESPKASSPPEDSFGSACSAVPPLDQVTTCSEDCSDDVSSVSSCSIEDDTENDFTSFPTTSSKSSPSPRSIFKNYWGAQGQSHKLNRPVPTEISTQILRLLNDEENPSHNVYEETLREREEDAKAGLASKRRSIFSNRYQLSHSTPTLRTQKYYDLRRIQSGSALGQKPSRSCLRSGRYSGACVPLRRTSERSSESDNTSVRFSEKVEITVFESSLERYAEEGWSDFFAYR